MDLRPPRPAAGIEPAGWLTERIDLRGPHWVTNLLGSGFAAYARMFHPPQDHLRSVTWAEVARANGRKMHPWAQWNQINSPAEPSLARNPCAITRGPHLDTEALEALCAILARHTATAWSCYFALWEGRTPCRTASMTFTAYYAPDGVLPPDIKLPAPAASRAAPGLERAHFPRARPQHPTGFPALPVRGPRQCGGTDRTLGPRELLHFPTPRFHLARRSHLVCGSHPRQLDPDRGFTRTHRRTVRRRNDRGPPDSTHGAIRPQSI